MSLKDNAEIVPIADVHDQQTQQSYTRARDAKRVKAQAKFLEVIGEGYSIVTAAKAADIDRVTAYNWRHADPVFAAKWDECIVSGLDKVEDLVRKAAAEDWRAGVEILKAKRNDVWGNRVRNENNNTNTTTASLTVTVQTTDSEWLAGLIGPGDTQEPNPVPGKK